MSKEHTAETAPPVDWKQARALILSHCREPKVVELPLADAFGHVHAQSVLSPIDVPPFDNTAMDGYAVVAETTQDASRESPVCLTMIGTAAAGAPFDGSMRAGQAVEIMTGAPIPVGADAVVRVEDTSREDNSILIYATAAPGQFIRKAGADSARNSEILSKDMPIDAAAAALAASCGISKLRVYAKPRVAILVGGDEVVPPARAELRPGQIFESNSVMLHSLIRTWGIEAAILGIMPDESGQITEMLKGGLQYDVLLTTGGVSMGQYDYIRETLARLSCREVFWRVNQQPGGPLLFSVHGETLIFGLPGNPVSACVCADIYVREALHRLMGRASPEIPLRVTMNENLAKKHSKTAFVRGILQRETDRLAVRSTGSQDSNRIRSLLGRHGYIVFPGDRRELHIGEEVEFLLRDFEAFSRLAAECRREE